MFSKETYIARRKALKEKMGSGLLIFLGNNFTGMNYADNVYHFRQDSTFLYYFASDYEGLAAVIDVDNDKEIIFGDELTIDSIVWTGVQPTIKEKSERVGVEETRPMAGFVTYIRNAQAKGQEIHFLPPYRGEHQVWLQELLGINPAEQAEKASLKFIKAVVAQRNYKSDEEIAQIEAEIDDLQAQIVAAEATRVEPKDMDDYAERKDAIKARIVTLTEELHDMLTASSNVIEKLRNEESELMAAIREQMAIVNKESLLDYSRQRVEELREDARNSAECLEAIEKMLFLMDEYSRYKTRFVEDSINGLFRIARFRLFREQANGGVEDRCDVVHDGVPYISVNNGMKINLGIDIINTLSMAYGVKVPLFVDNAESVTNLESSSSQIIRLVVSENDKELRVNYEN